MKIAKLTLLQIKDILRTEKCFRDIDSWRFKHLGIGEMMHTYVLTKGNKNYFVKELQVRGKGKKNEAQAEYFLTQLKLNSLPWTNLPHLLKKGILVKQFINGKMLKSKNINMELIKEFAIFQNIMNNKRFYDKHDIFKAKNYSLKDEGYYEKGLRKNYVYATKKLNELKKRYPKLRIIKNFQEILGYIKLDKERIIKDYVSMPFARQHNDFREDNIMVSKDGRHLLIDWGSVFGYHPFLRDPAPFLVYNKKALETFTRYSDICKKYSEEQLKRWLYVALIARFLSILRWFLNTKGEKADTEEHLKKFLEYEYKTYKYLLKNEQ